MTGVVLVHTVSTVPAGLLGAAAWDVLRSRPVACGFDDHPQVAALAAAGVDVRVVGVQSADDVVALAPVVWLPDPSRYGLPGRDAVLVDALRHRPDVEEVAGAVEAPGARLLDAVAVMDRLRAPGGCPWDAEQTVGSLKRYLLEEAYEAVDAVDQGDLDGLRDELGDVLLQVLFNSRIAAEGVGGVVGAEGGPGWDVDDVAAGLVAKLVRRHPHVFAAETLGAPVTGAADVQTNWDAIKAAERAEVARRRGTEDPSRLADSPLAGVPMGMPALALAAKLQTRAVKAGLALPVGKDPAGTARELLDEASPRLGELLFAVVALARQQGVEPEAALRDVARSFRDRAIG